MTWRDDPEFLDAVTKITGFPDDAVAIMAAEAAVAARDRELRQAIEAAVEQIREAIEWPDGGGQPWSPGTYYDAATRDVIQVVLALFGVSGAPLTQDSES